tara:strand:- start:192 stop:419 length:228 start_codon:yes stop_codon:yes gene_type:complete
LTNESGTHLNSLAGRVAVKYRDVFHTTQAAAKIVPALRGVTEKAPLCVAGRLFRITTKTPEAFLSASPNGVRYMG